MRHVLASTPIFVLCARTYRYPALREAFQKRAYSRLIRTTVPTRTCPVSRSVNGFTLQQGGTERVIMPHSRRSSSVDVRKRSRRAYIALGSNMGDRLQMIEKACLALNADSRIKIKRTSSLYETEPMYVEDQARFLNGACEVRLYGNTAHRSLLTRRSGGDYFRANGFA